METMELMRPWKQAWTNPLHPVEDKSAVFIVLLAVAILFGDQRDWIEEDDSSLKKY